MSVEGGKVALRILNFHKLVENYRSNTASVNNFHTCAMVKTGSMGFKNPRPSVVT